MSVLTSDRFPITKATGCSLAQRLCLARSGRRLPKLPNDKVHTMQVPASRCQLSNRRREVNRTHIRNRPCPVTSRIRPVLLHPGKVALDRGATGAGQSLGHRGRDEGPFGQHSAQGWWRLPESGPSWLPPALTMLDIVKVPHRGQACCFPFRRASAPSAQPVGHWRAAPLPRPSRAVQRWHRFRRWPQSWTR